MSASSNAILRGMRAIFGALGLVRSVPVAPIMTVRAVGAEPTAAELIAAEPLVFAAAPLKLFATIELVQESERPEPPDGGTPAALPVPVLAQTLALATMYRSAQARPLAAQMALTAARNVPKARKANSSVKAATSSKPAQSARLPKRVTAIKAKPVVVVIKKKARKRRHVWLSTQSRVIRPILGNVVQMQADSRTPRQTARPAAQKQTVRLLKLAA